MTTVRRLELVLQRSLRERPYRPARESASADTRVPSELIVSLAATTTRPSSSSTIAQDGPVRISKRTSVMASPKQRRAAKKNIKKAIKAAERKQTLKHLPKKIRQALASKPRKSDNHESSISICTTEPPRSQSSQSTFVVGGLSDSRSRGHKW